MSVHSKSKTITLSQSHLTHTFLQALRLSKFFGKNNFHSQLDHTQYELLLLLFIFFLRIYLYTKCLQMCNILYIKMKERVILILISTTVMSLN